MLEYSQTWGVCGTNKPLRDNMVFVRRVTVRLPCGRKFDGKDVIDPVFSCMVCWKREQQAQSYQYLDHFSSLFNQKIMREFHVVLSYRKEAMVTTTLLYLYLERCGFQLKVSMHACSGIVRVRNVVAKNKISTTAITWDKVQYHIVHRYCTSQIPYSTMVDIKKMK
jgi:hypothetical protein